MNDNQTAPHPASLGRALKRGFRNAYDSLGYIVFATFISFLCGTAMFSLAVLAVKHLRPGMIGILLFLPAALVSWLCAVGICYYANKVIFGKHPVPADTFEGIKALTVPSLKLFAIDLIISVVLFIDVVFFLGMFGAKGGALFGALGVVAGYVVLIWLMMFMYHLPVLVAQMDMESGLGVKVVLRKSFLLMADNPGFTVGLFIVIIALAIICILPVFVGIAVLFLGAYAFLLTSALHELFIKYDIVEDEPELVDDKWKLPDSWMKRDREQNTESEDQTTDNLGDNDG